MKFYGIVDWFDEDDESDKVEYDTLEEAVKHHENIIKELGGCSLFDAKSSIVKDSKGKIYAKWENENDK